MRYICILQFINHQKIFWLLLGLIFHAFAFQESNPALRLKDDMIGESGFAGGRIEEDGQIKRRESPDFDDQNDLSGLEDENIIGGGLQRDISLNKVKSIATTTRSSSNEVDWKVNILMRLYINLLIEIFSYVSFLFHFLINFYNVISTLTSVLMLPETHSKRMKMFMVETNLIKRLVIV